jgi:hypothetical protein
MELPELYEAAKAIVSPTDWIERDGTRHSHMLTMIAHLEVDGVSIPGLRLRGTAIRNLPDRAVCFQLEYHRPRQHGAALDRIEWRPIKGHNNKGMGPAEHRFILMAGTHQHQFELNWNEAQKQLRRGNLPIAIPLSIEPDTYQRLLEVVGEHFNISGLERVQQPPWEADLV